jgi:hypothetical protein
MKQQKKSRPSIILATAILLLACTGCARIQKELGTPLEHHEFAADTHPVHYSEVLGAYGPPSKISALPGGGFGLTIVFKVKGLTDLTPNTLSQQGIMNWGLALTELPGVGLNRGQSLDSGSSGMEVMVVEDIIGQRTLELDRLR